MDVNDICDELAAIIEPDPTLRDDARARPATYDVDTLYLWPKHVVYQLVDTGYEDEERFVVIVAWTTDRVGGDTMDRSVSDTIVDRATAVRDALAAVAGQGDTFEQAHVDEIDYESNLGVDARGFILAISGYALRNEVT